MEEGHLQGDLQAGRRASGAIHTLRTGRARRRLDVWAAATAPLAHAGLLSREELSIGSIDGPLTQQIEVDSSHSKELLLRRFNSSRFYQLKVQILQWTGKKRGLGRPLNVPSARCKFPSTRRKMFSVEHYNAPMGRSRLKK